jgi:hypothetical protein
MPENNEHRAEAHKSLDTATNLKKVEEAIQDADFEKLEEAIDLENVAGSEDVDLDDPEEQQSITEILAQVRGQIAQDRRDENERRANSRMRQLLFYSIYALSMFVVLSTLTYLGLRVLNNHELNDTEKAAAGGVLGLLGYGMRTVLKFYFDAHPGSDEREPKKGR